MRIFKGCCGEIKGFVVFRELFHDRDSLFDRCTFYGLCKIYKIKGVAFSKDQGPF